VIASDGRLGGFSGHTEGASIERKRKLLVKEGVRFRADGRVAPECIHRFAAASGAPPASSRGSQQKRKRGA
jgi:hypothetical protein